jgi:hypothetical protein
MMKMRLSGGVLQMVLMLVLAVVLAGAAGYFIGHNSGKITERHEAKKRDQTQTSQGPWGKIRYWNSMLEMPGDMISLRSLPNDLTRWYMEFDAPELIEKFMIGCDVEPAVAKRIASTAQKWEGGRGLVVTPSDEDVLKISPSARSKLYRQMSLWQPNQTLADATRFSKIGLRDWLDGSDVSPQMTGLIRSLIYSNGETELFADYDIVLRRIKDNREARDFLRTMARRNCIMGSLVVGPNDSIEDLSRYWGRGGREMEVRTLLESTRLSEGTREVPLIMLMPQFVRDRLYRYRRASDPELANCHFTAMNFFNEVPDNSFTSLVHCADVIQSDYVTVTDNNLQLGDLIIFMPNDQEILHSCNYIAANIVFTKNGSSQGQPWVLADIKETEGFFSVERPVVRRVLRKKEFMVGAPL